MIPSDNPSESSTSTPTARILSADATAATHSDGQCDSDPTMPDGQSGSPSEPLSIGPSWPIRRKASWAKRRVSVNSLLRLAVAFPTKARSPSNNRTRRVPLPRDQHLAAGGEQRPEQASPSHHEVCAHHGDSIYRNPQTQQQQGFLPIPRMSVPLCSPLKARQKEICAFPYLHTDKRCHDYLYLPYFLCFLKNNLYI